jgi:hypothetical protein
LSHHIQSPSSSFFQKNFHYMMLIYTRLNPGQHQVSEYHIFQKQRRNLSLTCRILYFNTCDGKSPKMEFKCYTPLSEPFRIRVQQLLLNLKGTLLAVLFTYS